MLGGCQILHTPGHTPGHLSLYLPALSLLIAGDILRYENGAVTRAPEMYTADAEANEASLRMLAGLEFERTAPLPRGLSRHRRERPDAPRPWARPSAGPSAGSPPSPPRARVLPTAYTEDATDAPTLAGARSGARWYAAEADEDVAVRASANGGQLHRSLRPLPCSGDLPEPDHTKARLLPAGLRCVLR